jgi:hypothetical protein
MMMSEEVKVDAPVPEAEPEGAIEVELAGQRQKVVPVGVVAAERKRARESTEQKFKGELDALKAKAAEADQLRADLGQLQPYIEHLKTHGLPKKEEPPEIAKVSDSEAEKYARDYELYTATGLDLGKAKRIIANQREETRKIAAEAAQEAIKPLATSSATQQSRANFVWAAQEAQKRGVQPETVAQLWGALPPDLTQHPEVAQLLLRASLGEAMFSGKMAQPPQHEPLFSEPPGGPRGQDYKISDVERRMAMASGLTEKDWTDRAKGYQPDAENVLGD